MNEETSPFTQHPYRCRLEWGRRGARAAVERGDIVVIVDVLSFSSVVATAVQHGGVIYPCAKEDDAAAIAWRVGGEVAVGRGEVPTRGRFSLSPLTYEGLAAGTRIVLPSPNGATCSRYASAAPALLVGALLNATAVTSAVARLLDTTGLCVTVVACGERWETPSEDGDLRVALEDALGAGAILAGLPYPASPEARLCAAAFQAMRDGVAELLWECGSGRELRARGFGEDVRHAARLDAYDAVPIMRGACLERLA